MKRHTLRQLEYFLAVAAHSSMTAAAEECFVTPGTIALAMNDLEKSLGVQLLARQTSKGVTLTSMGWIALDKARAILRDSRELEELASRARGELTGSLKIGCFSTMSPWIMPVLLEHFTQNHPNVAIDIVEGSSVELQELLVHGHLDVCFVFSSHLQGTVEGELIREVRLCVLVSDEDDLAQEDSISLRQLGDRPAILLNLSPATELVEGILRGAGLNPQTIWRSSNFETVCSTVARGLAYGVLNNLPLESGVSSRHGLKLLHIRDALPENALVAAVPRGQPPTANVLETLACARTFFTRKPETP